MDAHPKATQVQGLGVLALGRLAMNEDKRGKITYLGGVDAVLHARGAHPEATQGQESGCHCYEEAGHG